MGTVRRTRETATTYHYTWWSKWYESKVWTTMFIPKNLHRILNSTSVLALLVEKPNVYCGLRWNWILEKHTSKGEKKATTITESLEILPISNPDCSLEPEPSNQPVSQSATCTRKSKDGTFRGKGQRSPSSCEWSVRARIICNTGFWTFWYIQVILYRLISPFALNWAIIRILSSDEEELKDY